MSHEDQIRIVFLDFFLIRNLEYLYLPYSNLGKPSKMSVWESVDERNRAVVGLWIVNCEWGEIAIRDGNVCRVGESQQVYIVGWLVQRVEFGVLNFGLELEFGIRNRQGQDVCGCGCGCGCGW